MPQKATGDPPPSLPRCSLPHSVYASPSCPGAPSLCHHPPYSVMARLSLLMSGISTLAKTWASMLLVPAM